MPVKTKSDKKSFQLQLLNKRLGNILMYRVNRNESLEIFISDMKAIYDIPDGYDHTFEKANPEVMELYRMAEGAREPERM